MKLTKKIMAAALVGAMALTAAVVDGDKVTVEAADSVVPTNSPITSIRDKQIREDGTVSITLGWSNATMCTFDYGILFDETKLEFVNMSPSAEFSEAYQGNGTSGDGGVSEYGEVVTDEGSYIAFGGVYYGNGSYSGDVITLNFVMKEGAGGAGILTVVKDGSGYDSLAAMKAATPLMQRDLDSNALMGDVNGDGLVNSDDAVMVLRKFANLSTDGMIEEAADVNGDTLINSDDAVEILKKFANLPSVLD